MHMKIILLLILINKTYFSKYDTRLVRKMRVFFDFVKEIVSVRTMDESTHSYQRNWRVFIETNLPIHGISCAVYSRPPTTTHQSLHPKIKKFMSSPQLPKYVVPHTHQRCSLLQAFISFCSQTGCFKDFPESDGAMPRGTDLFSVLQNLRGNLQMVSPFTGREVVNV